MPDYGYTGNIKLKIDDKTLGKELKSVQNLLSKQLGKKLTVEVNFTTPAIKRSIAGFAKELERKINEIEFNPKINENFIKKMSKFEEKLAKDLNIKKSKWNKLAETRASKFASVGRIQDPGKVYQRAIAEDYEQDLKVRGIHSKKSDRFQKEEKKTIFAEGDHDEYLKVLNNILDINTKQLVIFDSIHKKTQDTTKDIVDQDQVIKKEKKSWLNLVNPLKWFNKATKEGNELLKKRTEIIDRNNKELKEQNNILGISLKKWDLLNDSFGLINSKFIHLADYGMDFWHVLSRSNETLTKMTPAIAVIMTTTLGLITWTQKRYVQQVKTLAEIKKQTEGILDANSLTRDAIVAVNKGQEDSITFAKRLNYQFNVSEDTLAKINDDVSKLGMIQMIGTDQVAYVRQFQKEVAILSQNIGENAENVSQWAYQLANVQNEADLSKVLDQISMFSSGAKYSTMSTQNFRDMIVGLTSDFDALGGNVEAATEFGMKFGAAMKKELGIADKNIARLMGTWEKGVEEMTDGAKLLVAQEFVNDAEVLKQFEKIDAEIQKRRRGKKYDKDIVRQFGHLEPMITHALKQKKLKEEGKIEKIDVAPFALTIKNSMKDFAKFPAGMRKLAESQFKVIKGMAEQAGGEDIAGTWMGLAKTMGAQSLEQQKLIANIGISGGTLEEMFKALDAQTGQTIEELQDQAKALKLNADNAQALTKQQRSSVENLIQGIDLAISDLGSEKFTKAFEDFSGSLIESAEQVPFLKDKIQELSGIDFESFKKQLQSGEMTDSLKEGLSKVGKWIMDNKGKLLAGGAALYAGSKFLGGGRAAGQSRDIIGMGTEATLEGGVEALNEGTKNISDQLALLKQRTEEIGLGGKIGKWTGRTIGAAVGGYTANKVAGIFGAKDSAQLIEKMSKMSADEFAAKFPGMTKEQAEESIKKSQEGLSLMGKLGVTAAGALAGDLVEEIFGVGESIGDKVGKALANFPFFKTIFPGIAKKLDPRAEMWRKLIDDIGSGMEPDLAIGKAQLEAEDEQLTELQKISRNTGLSLLTGGGTGGGILGGILGKGKGLISGILGGLGLKTMGTGMKGMLSAFKDLPKLLKARGMVKGIGSFKSLFGAGFKMFSSVIMGKLIAILGAGVAGGVAGVVLGRLINKVTGGAIDKGAEKLSTKLFFGDAEKTKHEKELGLGKYRGGVDQRNLWGEYKKRSGIDLKGRNDNQLNMGITDLKNKITDLNQKRAVLEEKIGDAEGEELEHIGNQLNAVKEIEQKYVEQLAKEEEFKNERAAFIQKSKETNDKFLKQWEDEYKADLAKLEKGEEVGGNIKTKEDLLKLHKDRMEQLKKGVLLGNPEAAKYLSPEEMQKQIGDYSAKSLEQSMNKLKEQKSLEKMKSVIENAKPQIDELTTKIKEGLDKGLTKSEDFMKSLIGPETLAGITAFAGIAWDKAKEMADKLLEAIQQFIKYCSDPSGLRADLVTAYTNMKENLSNVGEYWGDKATPAYTTGAELFKNVADFLPQPQTLSNVGNYFSKTGGTIADYAKKGAAAVSQMAKPFAEATVKTYDVATGDATIQMVLKNARALITPEVSKGIRDNERQKMQ